jgi:IS5 family transposase
MKSHVGVDEKTKLIHSVVVTTASVHDSQKIKDLLHGGETRVWGDKAYAGQTEAIHEKAPLARDWTLKKSQRNRELTVRQKQTNHIRAKRRARVEHVFGTLKHVFHFRRVRYKGLMKNANRFTVTKDPLKVFCALVNLFTIRKRLLAITWMSDHP